MTRYSGKLDSELVPDFSMMSVKTLARMSNDANSGARFRLPADAVVFQGTLKHTAARLQMDVLLIESASSGAWICADLNHDGRFSEQEKFRFRPVPQRPKAIGDAIVPLPFHRSPYRSFPIRFRLFLNAEQPVGPADPGGRTIFYSYTAFVTGAAKIGSSSEPLRIWCAYRPESGLADPLHGIVGMDLNGDGILDAPPSLERADAAGEEVVFEVRGEYLSIHRIDLATRTFRLRSHPASDYARVKLEVGNIFPDFAFTDFQDNHNHLSDIRARYVLLDIWGSWCGPCVGEFPTMRLAYEKFRTRGFEILGIDAKESSDKAYECISRNHLPWMQATPQSTAELVERRLNVTAYPTMILLDHARRIVSVGTNGLRLRGEGLLQAMDKLLPQQ